MPRQKISKKLAKAEAYAIAAEMLKQALESGVLWQYNEQSSSVIEDAAWDLVGRLENRAGLATYDTMLQYKAKK